MKDLTHSINAYVYPRDEFGKSEAARLMRVGNFFPRDESPNGNLFEDVGNDVLYHFCEEYPLPDGHPCDTTKADGKSKEQEVILAAKMWLIGRSYAASPERYAYRKGEKCKKPEELGPEGYESFFNDIAGILIEGKPYYRGVSHDKKDIDNSKNDEVSLLKAKSCSKQAKLLYCETLHLVKGLNGGDYELVGDSGDIDTLRVVSDAVYMLGRAIQQARTARDWTKIARGAENCHEVKTECQDFPLSFSSKFLHFHLPRLVFIYDSISGGALSSNNVRRCFSETSDGGNCENGFLEVRCVPRVGAEEARKQHDRYYLHAAKELALATAIYKYVKSDEDLRKALEEGLIETGKIPCYFSITRMIDALVTNSRKPENKSEMRLTTDNAFDGVVEWE